MTKRSTSLTVALLLGLGATTAAATLPRGALRHVVLACVMAKRTLGVSAPCLSVDLGSEDRPGTVKIRAPGSATHIIVTPVESIDGVEDRRLLQPAAGLYWRTALAARPLVVEAVRGAVPTASVGLAVNSEATRSQDHLHIHAECVRPSILTALRSQSEFAAGGWHRLQRAVAGEHPYARRLSPAEIEAGNVFGILATVPGGRHDTAGGVKALLVELPDTGGFLLAGIRSTTASVEAYFDEACTEASSRTSRR